MTKAPFDRKEAYNSISRYCDYQDRCAQEVRHKLKRLGVPEYEATSIIDQLLDEDLINEERFALNYTRGKFRIKNWGRVRIRTELRSKGISNAHIAKAMDALDPVVYHQVLHDFATRKLESLSVNDVQARRKKLWDALIYRGWEKDIVYDKIRELIP